MLTTIIQSAAAGWLWRRVQELGSLATIFVPIYLAMPQSMKNDVHAIFSGQGGGLTISAAIGLGWYVWTQLQSYRATTKAQVVTTDGTKIALPKSGAGISTTRKVEALAEAAKPPRTLWDRITGK
ncbi:hypothetical protein [Devosia sp. 2618]|uniref:hypothetical protein n=1 Tax=Devosia sp. 2618 TaxID=3156454 RepID=UPI003395A70A